MKDIKRQVQNFYKFCPHCGNPLGYKILHGNRELACSSCNFIFWLNSKPAVSAFFVKGSSVLLAKRAINPRKGYWDPFGGFLDFHENPETGLRRELKEELGVTISKPAFLGIYIGEYGNNPIQSTCNIYYIVRNWKGKLTPQDDVASLKWFDERHLPKKIAFAYIRNAFSGIKKALH
jgi:ADP-ribose pyrophosphatase YjhB (NUDIX family)